MPVRVRPLLLGAALLSGASSVTGQTPPPSPPDQSLGQDELDLQARANVVEGSGARALGMGGAFLARADDATAASWNPAGLSYLQLPEVSFVYSGSRLASLEVSSATRKDDQLHGHAPDFFAATYPFEVKRLSGAAQVSFQRLIPFGGQRTIARTFYDPVTGTSTTGTPSEVASSGGFDVISFGTGVSLWGKLRLGATVNRWLNGYHQTLERDTSRVTPGHTTQQSDYHLSAWNINVGAMWSLGEAFNLGLVYKTAFTGTLSIDKSRQDTPPSPPRTNEATSAELGSPVSLDLPAAVGVGASWRPRSRLTVSADYTRTFWSKGEIHNFFSLPARVAGVGDPTIYPTLPYPTLDTTQAQHDTVQLRGGAEFVLILGRVKIPVRAGAFSDRQYIQTADGQAPYFTGLSAGTGLVFGPMLLDFAFIRETGHYHALTDGADTAVSVHSRRLVGSVIYRLPRH